MQPRASVTIDGRWIEAHIRLEDEEGAAFLASKHEDAARAETAESALRIGLRALAVADHDVLESLLTQKLVNIVDQATLAADASLTRASATFEEVWTRRVDEGLAVRLDAHSQQLEERFQALFGAASDKSIENRVRRLLDEYQHVVTRELVEDRIGLRRELSELIRGNDDPGHPLQQIQNQLPGSAPGDRGGARGGTCRRRGAAGAQGDRPGRSGLPGRRPMPRSWPCCRAPMTRWSSRAAARVPRAAPMATSSSSSIHD